MGLLILLRSLQHSLDCSLNYPIICIAIFFWLAIALIQHKTLIVHHRHINVAEQEVEAKVISIDVKLEVGSSSSVDVLIWGRSYTVGFVLRLARKSSIISGQCGSIPLPRHPWPGS